MSNLTIKKYKIFPIIKIYHNSKKTAEHYHSSNQHAPLPILTNYPNLPQSSHFETNNMRHNKIDSLWKYRKIDNFRILSKVKPPSIFNKIDGGLIGGEGAEIFLGEKYEEYDPNVTEYISHSPKLRNTNLTT